MRRCVVTACGVYCRAQHLRQLVLRRATMPDPPTRDNLVPACHADLAVMYPDLLECTPFRCPPAPCTVAPASTAPHLQNGKHEAALRQSSHQHCPCACWWEHGRRSALPIAAPV